MDLNTILIVLGVLALIALVAHGIWSNRREKTQYFKNAETFKQGASSIQRTNDEPSHIRSPRSATASDMNTSVHAVQNPTVTDFAQPPKQQQLDFETPYYPEYADENIAKAASEIQITLPNEADYQAPKQAETYQQSYYAQAEPALSQSQYELKPVTPLEQDSSTFNNENSAPRDATMEAQAESQSETATSAEKRPEFMLLYVVAPENREFQGSHLLEAFESLGFCFGEKNIFHRHLDLSVSSPILFSIANIQDSGTFDFYNMTNMSTEGLAIFMQLPSSGNDRVNLRTMIRAAQTLAEDLGGFVLDQNQQIFTEEVEQEYLSKVS